MKTNTCIEVFVNMIRGMKCNVWENMKRVCIFSLQYPFSRPVLFSGCKCVKVRDERENDQYQRRMRTV